MKPEKQKRIILEQVIFTQVKQTWPEGHGCGKHPVSEEVEIARMYEIKELHNSLYLYFGKNRLAVGDQIPGPLVEALCERPEWEVIIKANLS